MIEKSRAEEAVSCYNECANCAKAVLSTYSEQFGLDADTAKKICCGLAGGGAMTGRTCGAVMGAYLLINLRFGIDAEANKAIKEFDEKFEKRNKYTGCNELLGFDIKTIDSETLGRRAGEVCAGLVRDAAEIAEEIIF